MQTIFFRETAHGHDANRGGGGELRSDAALHRRVPLRRPGREPARWSAVRPAAAAGSGRQASARGAAAGEVLVSPDKSSVYYQGTLNDKNPRSRAKTFSTSRDQDRREEALFESDNKTSTRASRRSSTGAGAFP